MVIKRYEGKNSLILYLLVPFQFLRLLLLLSLAAAASVPVAGAAVVAVAPWGASITCTYQVSTLENV